MLPIVIGLTYGGIVGLVQNLCLFWYLRRRPAGGRGSLRSLVGLFFLRYLVDLVALLAYWRLFRHTGGLAAAAIAIALAIQVSLWIAYRRKGGRL